MACRGRPMLIVIYANLGALVAEPGGVAFFPRPWARHLSSWCMAFYRGVGAFARIYNMRQHHQAFVAAGAQRGGAAEMGELKRPVRHPQRIIA